MVRPLYLIVGGTGYFGARLAEALSANIDLVLTYRTASPARAAWLERRGFTAVRFNSAADSTLPGDEFDCVINLAMPSSAEATRDAAGGRRRALATAQACLDLIETGRAKRVIHISTFHVYGDPGRPRYDEHDLPAPMYPYGKIHLDIEQRLQAHPGAEQIVIARATNLVGAPAHADLGDQTKLLFLDVCRQAAQGAVHLSNDGQSYRDFLPFDDAIAAVRLLLSPSVPAGIYNLGCGKAQRLDAIARTIAEASPRDVSITYGNETDAFRLPFAVSTARLQHIGWMPQSHLTIEAKRCIDFFS